MIRAALIDENSGIVESVIMAIPEDFSSRPNVIIAIPKITSNDGVLSFDLGINKRTHKWDGSKFTDLDGNEVLFDADTLKKIDDYNKLHETVQVPPEVI